MRTNTLFALAASLSSTASAAYQGFNYGTTLTDGSAKTQQIFEDEFNTAKGLVGTSGWTSARLYTSIQGGTANTPVEAIPAAIKTKTSLLLGIWASGGQPLIDAEIAALKTAIGQYPDLGTYVAGISVGSEDLYRISPTGIINKSGVGAQPNELISYIKQVREAIAGTSLSGVPIGHVDTWNDWTNGSNSAVIQAVDWLGVDAYPYFQSTMANSIDNGPQLFDDAFSATTGAAGGKPVWITEVGWPVSGPKSNEAVASVANAEKFWKKVACKYIGNTNLYWYTLSDSVPTTPSPSFGIVGNPLTTTPVYDLSCPSGGDSSSSSAIVKSTSAVETATSAVETATSAGKTSNSAVESTTSVLEPTSTPEAATSTIAESSTSKTESPAETTTAIATGGLTPSEGAGNGVPSSAVYTYSKSISSIPASFSTVPTGTGGSSAPVTAVTATASSSLYGHGSSTNTTVVTPTITSGATTSSFSGAAATMGPAAFLGGAVGVVAAVMAAL